MLSYGVSIDGFAGSARLRLPDHRRPSRALVTLHGAELATADQPLFEHLAEVATPLGYAVLSYDRRPVETGDVPLQQQADDALAALRWTMTELGVTAGLFGFSQGAWAAALAAVQDTRVAQLVLVGCSGVSPAAQMRYFTDEALRRHGFPDVARAELNELRIVVEDVLRGSGDHIHAEQLLTRARTQPWFDLACLPCDLHSPQHTWDDMDYDPAPTFAQVTCPTLLLYGEDEECVPAEQSKAVWSAATNTDLTIADVPGCGHFPSPLVGGQGIADISPAYTIQLTNWLSRQGARSLEPGDGERRK